MSSYTCNSCSLQFESADGQRLHMKSDWHRYNLKRRVANLPPIDEQTFDLKVKQNADGNAGDTARTKQMTKKEQRRKEKEALLEKKRQLLEIARQRMVAKEAQEVSEEEEEEEEATVVIEPVEEENTPEKLIQEKLKNKVDIPLEQCLFCTKSKTFPDFEANLDHMFRCHGFYIPEQKYLEDKEGLVKYMSEKIGLGNVCIVCDFQARSLPAIRSHMLDKRHCKIPYESEDEKLEISEFYNFSSTYDDSVTVNSTTSQNDDDWEDVEGQVSDNDDDIEPTQEYLYHDGVELHLPTGIKVGHRSLQRYYKQDLKPEKELTEGQGTLVAAETRTFINMVDRKTVQVQQRAWKSEVKDKKTHDKRAAKFINNQPQYRDQLLQ